MFNLGYKLSSFDRYSKYFACITEAVLGNRGNMAFISGEQGNKGQIWGEQGNKDNSGGTGNSRKQIFDFWGTGEQANLFQGNKGTGTPPPEGLVTFSSICNHTIRFSQIWNIITVSFHQQPESYMDHCLNWKICKTKLSIKQYLKDFVSKFWTTRRYAL